MGRSRSIILGAVFTVLLSAPSALAASTDDAQVRFVHAVPGVGLGTLTADGQDVGAADFGETSDMVAVPSGPAQLELSAPDGVELSAAPDLTAGASYTVIALPTKDGAELRLFENRAAKAGLARLRVIHAAPELGDADLAIGGEVIAEGSSYTDETDYLQLQPGDYRVSVRSPQSGKAVLADNVALAAGTSDTALLVGSQGEETRVVLVEDDVATPDGAPETGFGGLARADERGGPDWPLATVAALAAGLLGLATWSLRARPSRLPRGS